MMMKLKQEFFQIDSLTASSDIYKLAEVGEVGRSLSKSIILQIYYKQENKYHTCNCCHNPNKK